MAKRGRPPLKPPKKFIFNFRITTAQRRAYARAAEREGRGLSNWAAWHLDLASGLRKGTRAK